MNGEAQKQLSEGILFSALSQTIIAPENIVFSSSTRPHFPHISPSLFLSSFVLPHSGHLFNLFT
jgi:hypothetical protein